MAFDGVMMHYVKEEIKSVALDARSKSNSST